MKYLVISSRHHLLPFAWRLHREGVEVETVVLNDGYEKAWEQLLPKAVRGKGKNRHWWTEQIEASKNGELIVLTDSPKYNSYFEGGRVFGTYAGNLHTQPAAFGVGGWYDGGRLSHLHYLIGDWGLWPGGLGASVFGAMTALFPGGSLPPVPTHFISELPEMRDFAGLVSWWVDVGQHPDGTYYPTFHSHQFGWPWLSSHLFVSELGSLSNLLSEGSAAINKQFITAVPISVPPWPTICSIRPNPRPVGGLTNDDLASIFLHDFELGEDKELKMSGLDGLLGVVRGSGDDVLEAREAAVRLAAKIEMGEKQFRVDAGVSVYQVLNALEKTGLLTLGHSSPSVGSETSSELSHHTSPLAPPSVATAQTHYPSPSPSQ